MDRRRATWILSFVFVVFLFLGELPVVGNLAVFSEETAFVLLVILYLVSSFVNWGPSKAGAFLLSTWVVSYLIEVIGVSTGYPFGVYAYTNSLGPLIGPVPIFIPFLWCALGYFCLQAAGRSIIVPAILMVSLDFSLDPVFSRALWHWAATMGPAYYGVPVLNFFGWFLTSVVVFTVFRAISPSGEKGWSNVLYSKPSQEGVAFYFLFGMTTVLVELNAGIPYAAAASILFYLAAAGFLWTRSSRAGEWWREP